MTKTESRNSGSAQNWLARAREGRCFTEDLHPPGCLHAAFVRSPHAHALIESVDQTIEGHDGVVAVFTASDLEDHIQAIPCIVPLTNRDGTKRADPPRTLLARGRARHQGEAIAMVVARTAKQARLAARRLSECCKLLPAVTDGLAALEPRAAQVWEEAPGNVCFDWELGDPQATEAAFRSAAHVVEAPIRNNRIVVAAMETRSAIACRDVTTGQRVLVTATQGVHWVRDLIAQQMLGIAAEQLEVVTPRVGGSFGSKIFVYPEQVLVLIAADRLGETVKWCASRDESFLSDTQGRDYYTRAALALDADGHILALRADTVANLGAHLSNYAPFNPTTCGAPLLCGAYRIGSMHARVRGVFTHTPPVDSYRGAGRPEANYILERLLDLAARRLGMDRAELRLRNLVSEHDLPFTTATGLRLESGLFRRNMEQAIKIADYAGFAARREESGRRKALRGIGIANFLEANGGMALARIMEPNGLPKESARLAFQRDGSIRVDIGTQSSGQGHAYVYAKILADRLHWREKTINVHQGRTDRLAQGTGTGGSKSLLSGSIALIEASEAVINKARCWRAARLHVAVEMVQWSDGMLLSPGQALPLVAAAQLAGEGLLAHQPHPFDVEVSATVHRGTYGNGCHLCEVEIDPQTGVVRILNYLSVNDFGTVVSPAHVIAQVQGAIVQGIGQALFEEARFNPDGRLETCDFSRYHIPQASELPRLSVFFSEGDRGQNPLGLKGCAESGASAAPPAVINAIHDALAQAVGERSLDVQMPATPPKLWALLHEEGAR